MTEHIYDDPHRAILRMHALVSAALSDAPSTSAASHAEAERLFGEYSVLRLAFVAGVAWADGQPADFGGIA